MAHTKLYGKDLKAYQDVDLDALLAKLTDEELEELHTELIDPDVRVNLVAVRVQIYVYDYFFIYFWATLVIKLTSVISAKLCCQLNYRFSIWTRLTLELSIFCQKMCFCFVTCYRPKCWKNCCLSAG